jgi:hypothetical protein
MPLTASNHCGSLVSLNRTTKWYIHSLQLTKPCHSSLLSSYTSCKSGTNPASHVGHEPRTCRWPTIKFTGTNPLRFTIAFWEILRRTHTSYLYVLMLQLWLSTTLQYPTYTGDADEARNFWHVAPYNWWPSTKHSISDTSPHMCCIEGFNTAP